LLNHENVIVEKKPALSRGDLFFLCKTKFGDIIARVKATQ